MVFVVEIVDDCSNEKPFLGGWRNTVTGTVYYNACTQTSADEKENYNKRNCGVQMVDLVDASTNTNREKAVQTSFLPDLEDRFVRDRGSFTTTITEPTGLTNLPKQTNRNIEESVIKIQRCYRAHRKKNLTKGTAPSSENSVQQGIDFLKDASGILEEIDLERLDDLHPETKSDFDRLYNAVDRWRISAIKRATDKLFRPSKIAMCSLILSKEVELLRKIDAMKTAVKLKLKERRERKFLDELSKPVRWKNSRDETILVDTPIVQRAREFLDTYDQLCKDDLVSAERIKILSKIKKDAEPHTCIYSDELIYLINQEIDLLSRGVDGSKLSCLRERIKLAFLLFAKSSLQAHLRDVDEDTDRSTTRVCKSCGRVLPSKKYLRDSRFRAFSSCVYCITLRPGRTPRIVYDPYRRMLREIRRLEARDRCHTGLAFVMGPKLVYRLVNAIWHGKSAISECDQLDRLCLVRFRNELEWSPWNSLLLTKEEALQHRKVQNLEEYYAEDLLRKFRIKNMQARLCFRSLLESSNDEC
ncbi:hypothetical protein KPH14_004523 [Odynerus spinipes]|uniref:IQ motif and ubiquitin-like domain-containing protein n=1 Tax=Odynerus spinipes TaxID=1348599 RepID=A0AAD9RLW1_9HYME|nr:hypothetical protein KPH14_004523 [Odynerus spinipes]